jgi:hypothetical protein
LELEQLERRLSKLRDIYMKDHKVFSRIDDLLKIVRGRAFHHYMKGQTEETSDGTP